MGLYALFKRDAGALAARALISATFWTIVAYFIWHSLHARSRPIGSRRSIRPSRSQPPSPPTPARWRGARGAWVDFLPALGGPSGILLFALLIVQANTGALSAIAATPPCAALALAGANSRRDRSGSRARRRGLRIGAGLRHTGWLAFYLPKGTCVVQPTQRIRWVTCPSRIGRCSAGKLLSVDEARPGAPSVSEGHRSRG